MCVCVCTMYMHDLCENQMRVLDALVLELGVAVSHHVYVGNQTQVLCKSNKCS